MTKHLCNCKTLIDNEEILIDVCIECGKKFRYNKEKKTGRIDNRKYREQHSRDFIQRSNPLYEKYYGKNNRSK